MSLPLLSAILWTPFVGMLFVVCLGPLRSRAQFGVAAATSVVALLLSLVLGVRFQPVAGVQFAEFQTWAPEIGMGYALGVDGLSLPLVVLTTLMSMAAVLAVNITPVPQRRGFLAWLLFLEFGLVGVFVSTDWFLFYMFWELTLIPMFFLIGIWGGRERHAASLTFFLYTLAGSIPMLMSLLAAHVATPVPTFSMAAMAQASTSWSASFQLALMIGLLCGFAVKIPIVPLHGWLPLAHVEAPIPASMMLSAVLLKMGGYGVLRAGFLAPAGLRALAVVFLAAGLFNIVYGAVQASRQTDLKAMVAWSSVSHMGFVLLGISAMNEEGILGASLEMFTHGLISGLLFLGVGLLYARTHTRNLDELSGAARALPGGFILFAVALMANLGAPGLAGFVSEVHALVGALDAHGLIVLIATGGVILTAGWCLTTLSALTRATGSEPLPALSTGEKAAAAPLVLLIIVVGLAPRLILSPIASTVRDLVGRLP